MLDYRVIKNPIDSKFKVVATEDREGTAYADSETIVEALEHSTSTFEIPLSQISVCEIIDDVFSEFGDLYDSAEKVNFEGKTFERIIEKKSLLDQVFVQTMLE